MQDAGFGQQGVRTRNPTACGLASSSDVASDACDIVVACFGSPHGDDQVGWRVAERLERRRGLPARVVAVYEISRLFAGLDGCAKLIVVDACRSGAAPGTISRLEWPDRRVAERHGNSTHAFGATHALRLAEALGRLPETVVVYGIEAEQYNPGQAMSPEVAAAGHELMVIIVAELYGPVWEEAAQ